MDSGLLLSLATLCDDNLPPPKLWLWNAVRQRLIIARVKCWSRDGLSRYCGTDGVDAPQRPHMRVFRSMVHAWSFSMNASAVSGET
jgi:hypothetical protein